MNTKIGIVTGGNTGIGKATVAGLARAGTTVVIACRDLEKGRAAADDIRGQLPSADLRVMRLDLASLQSVREFAAGFTKEFSRLDVLIENAGVSTGKRQLTVDGFEMDFGVNHLGHMLLAELLLPTLKASAPSRIVVLSSSLYKSSRINFDDLQGEKTWSAMGSYGQSKLANLLFVRVLAKRLAGTGVAVNAVHPGVIASELARDFPAPFRLMAKWFFKSTDKGALTSLHVATAPEAANISGEYFADSKVAKVAGAGLDDAAAERLWTESERLIRAAPSGAVS